MTPQYALALQDMHDGFTNWLMWGRLGWMEIRRRYRRTFLGPFWSAFSLAVMVFTIGYLWAALFNQPQASYMPYLTAGLIVWQFLAACMTEGSTVFTANAGLLTSMRVSQTLLVLTMIWRNIIVFGHNLLIFIVVMLIWKVPLTWSTPLFALGLLLVAVNGIWIALLLGLISTRFRDVPQLIGGLIMILMFLTPVMWSTDLMRGRQGWSHLVLDLNPLYHVIEVVRAPLLGQHANMISWIVVALMIPVGYAVTLVIFSRFRQRVPYWL